MEQLRYNLLIVQKTNYTVAVYRVFGILQLVFCTSYGVLVRKIIFFVFGTFLNFIFQVTRVKLGQYLHASAGVAAVRTCT